MGLFGKSSNKDATIDLTKANDTHRNDESKPKALVIEGNSTKSDKKESWPPEVPKKKYTLEEYIEDRNIIIESELDKETVKQVRNSTNSDHSGLHKAVDLEDALDDHDTNMLIVAEALIEQNFMLMRKIDKLNSRIDDLESRISSK